MIRHPMQKCPAEFVPLFREILENSYWGNDAGNHFICLRVKQWITDTDPELKKDVVKWIDESLGYFDTFNHWLCATNKMERMPPYKYVNQCRKAWLEWLISPEGHYDE